MNATQDLHGARIGVVGAGAIVKETEKIVRTIVTMIMMYVVQERFLAIRFGLEK